MWGYSISGHEPAQAAAGRRAGLTPGLRGLREPPEHAMLLCVTEMNTREEIDRLVEALGRLGGAQ